MVFGKDNNNVRKLNLCILFTNYYLHYHEVNEMNLDWIEFTTKVNNKLRIEKNSGLFPFSVLLMLSKGFRLIKGYVVFKEEK